MLCWSTARTFGGDCGTCDHAAELGFHYSLLRVAWRRRSASAGTETEQTGIGIQAGQSVVAGRWRALAGDAFAAAACGRDSSGKDGCSRCAMTR